MSALERGAELLSRTLEAVQSASGSTTVFAAATGASVLLLGLRSRGGGATDAAAGAGTDGAADVATATQAPGTRGHAPAPGVYTGLLMKLRAATTDDGDDVPVAPRGTSGTPKTVADALDAATTPGSRAAHTATGRRPFSKAVFHTTDDAIADANSRHRVRTHVQHLRRDGARAAVSGAVAHRLRRAFASVPEVFAKHEGGNHTPGDGHSVASRHGGTRRYSTASSVSVANGGVTSTPPSAARSRRSRGSASSWLPETDSTDADYTSHYDGDDGAVVVRLPVLPVVGSQHHSGRCWMFAGLNVIRADFMRVLSLPRSFAFSRSHLVRYEKLEKADAFFSDCERTWQLEMDAPLVSHLFKAGPCRDGCDYQVFRRLVLKYGLVPEEHCPESHFTADSMDLTQRLNTVARHYGMAIRRALRASGGAYDDPSRRHEARRLRQLGVAAVYRVLDRHLAPPVTTFEWHGDEVTPLQFLRRYVTPVHDLTRKVVLIAAEHLEPGRAYAVDHGKNSAGFQEPVVNELAGPTGDGGDGGGGADGSKSGAAPGRWAEWLNVSMEDLVHAARDSLVERREGVWFGCDVRKDCDVSEGLLDPRLFDPRVIGFTGDFLPPMSRSEACESGEGVSTHNMMISGVRLVPASDTAKAATEPSAFLIENSWGAAKGMSGYYVASIDWFRKHVYGLVVDEALLSDAALATWRTQRRTIIPPMDVFACL